MKNPTLGTFAAVITTVVAAALVETYSLNRRGEHVVTVPVNNKRGSIADVTNTRGADRPDTTARVDLHRELVDADTRTDRVITGGIGRGDRWVTEEPNSARSQTRDAANAATAALVASEAARLRPVRPSPPTIVRVDARGCRIVAGTNAIAFVQGGVTRSIESLFVCAECWRECHPDHADGSRQIAILFRDASGAITTETIPEVWP
jgi:hypothetical protein